MDCTDNVKAVVAKKTSYKIPYDALGTKTTVASGSSDVFAVANPDICGKITTCEIF